MQIDITELDDMLEEMKMIKTYYYEQLKRRVRHSKQSKMSQVKEHPQKSPQKRLAHSLINTYSSQSPEKNFGQTYVSTFVNIKDARYQIGPAQTYNFTKIQFPEIGKKRQKPGRYQQQVNNFQQLNEDMLNTSTKFIQRSNVKQSWNRYVNMNMINSSYGKKEEAKPLQKSLKRNHNKKDTTEQNIEGWKSYYNEEDLQNPPRA